MMYCAVALASCCAARDRRALQLTCRWAAPIESEIHLAAGSICRSAGARAAKRSARRPLVPRPRSPCAHGLPVRPDGSTKPRLPRRCLPRVLPSNSLCCRSKQRRSSADSQRLPRRQCSRKKGMADNPIENCLCETVLRCPLLPRLWSPAFDSS